MFATGTDARRSGVYHECSLRSQPVQAAHLGHVLHQGLAAAHLSRSYLEKRSSRLQASELPVRRDSRRKVSKSFTSDLPRETITTSRRPLRNQAAVKYGNSSVLRPGSADPTSARTSCTLRPTPSRLPNLKTPASSTS